MTRRIAAQTAAALALAGGLSTVCPAQPQPSTPQRTRIQIVRVKPDMLNEFLDLEKTEVVPALKKGGAKSRTAYQTVLYGNAFEYRFNTPFEKYAEFDEDGPQLKALGAAANARLGEKLRKCILGAETFLITQVPELSTTDPTTAPMLSVFRVRVAPDKRQAYIATVKSDIMPALKKAQVAVQANARGDGANPNDITFTLGFAKFADLDGPNPLVRALGQEALNKLLPKLDALGTPIEQFYLRRVPDLSF